MATAQINRSLTNIRTELEFLLDSEVIDQALYDALMASLPKRYNKDDAKWGIDKLSQISPSQPKSSQNVSEKAPSNLAPSGPSGGALSVAATTAALSATSLNDVPPPSYPPAPAPVPLEKIKGYYEALYNFESREMGDLPLKKGDKLAVVEELSADWWRGYKLSQLERDAGIFPSNYVTKITQDSFEAKSEKADSRPQYAPPPPSTLSLPYQSSGGYQSPSNPPLQTMEQQPSYGGYSQYSGGAPMNYGAMQPVPQAQSPYPPYQSGPPQQQQQYQAPAQQQQYQQAPQESGGLKFSSAHPHMSKFGSKLGDAAIFGAGATIGSEIVHSIF